MSLPLPVKLELIDRLGDAGLAIIEATSFVSPRWVPQLADADDADGWAAASTWCPLSRCWSRTSAVSSEPWRSVPDELAIFVSATETFAQAESGYHAGRCHRHGGTGRQGGTEQGIPVRGYVSMCFGDPWEGRSTLAAPAAVAARLMELGCATISLGDTIGVATAGHVVAVLDRVEAAGVPRDRIALHLHDTYGQALANVLAGLGGWSHRVRRRPPADSAAARTRNRRLATSLPRTWCGCWTALASRRGVDLTRLVRHEPLARRHVGSAVAIAGGCSAGQSERLRH